MYWNIYHEPADTDEPKKFIGTIQADTEGNALQKAAQWLEIPSHDLVTTRKDLDPFTLGEDVKVVTGGPYDGCMGTVVSLPNSRDITPKYGVRITRLTSIYATTSTTIYLPHYYLEKVVQQ